VLARDSTFSKLGIGRGEFSLMRKLATKYRAHPLGLSEKDAGKCTGKVAAMHSLTRGARLAALQAELGILTKRLINEARASFVQSGGAEENSSGTGAGHWRARLVRFVDESNSPENTLLVATLARGALEYPDNRATDK
jgi:hypothetical protein